MLLWYSDGLVERRDADLDAGLPRLASVASRLDGAQPQTWCDALLEQLTGGPLLHDDVVLICLRLLPSTPDAAGPHAVPVKGSGTPSPPRRLPDLDHPQQPAPNPHRAVLDHRDPAVVSRLGHHRIH
jgi:Stage II sporulation protein E (SpoIIE)